MATVKNKAGFLFLMTILFLLTPSILMMTKQSSRDLSKLTEDVENVIHQHKMELNEVLSNIQNNLSDNPDSLFTANKYFELLHEEKAFSFFLYKKDTLRFWSCNVPPVPHIFDDTLFSKNGIRLPNGWYISSVIHKQDQKLVGLIKVKSDFPYQNEHLSNEFLSEFNLPNDAQLNEEKGEYNIYDDQGAFLFSLEYPNSSESSRQFILLLFLLYFIGISFLLLLTYELYKKVDYVYSRKHLLIPALAFDLLLMRWLIFHFEVPQVLHESFLFSPFSYATSDWQPSLGDLFLNTVFLLYFSLVAFIELAPSKNINPSGWTRTKSVTIAASLIVLSFPLLKVVLVQIENLIINSNISFNINDLFNFDWLSLIGFFVIGSLGFVFFLLTWRIFGLAVSISKSFRDYLFSIFIPLLLAAIICFYAFVDQLIYLIFLFLFAVSVWYFISNLRNGGKFNGMLSFVLIFSALITFELYRLNTRKENMKREILAMDLATERDPVGEYLFGAIGDSISTDESFKQMAHLAVDNSTMEQEASEYLRKKYFSGYWSKYDMQLTVCSEDKLLEVADENIVINCQTYFENILGEFGTPTDNTILYYLDYDLAYDHYLATFEIENDTSNVNIYLELFSKVIYEGLGYPELLINQEITDYPDLSGYSYARYDNGELIQHYGKYFYSIRLENYYTGEEQKTYFDSSGYNHFFYQVEDDISLIVSRKNLSLFEIIAPYSYLVIFFLILGIFLMALVKGGVVVRFRELNFRNRMQISVVAIILASFLVVGFTTVYYIIDLNHKKNKDLLSEKAHSILIEMQHKLDDVETISPDIYDYLDRILTKFSNVFFSDINLYDLDGNLLASSRPEIFIEGLVSEKMNVSAYYQMEINKKSLFIHNEEIGNYEYLSAYVPFRNYQNRQIAYLNLPYFAKQDELKAEIYTFITTFLNIYFLLIAMAVFISLVVSNYITQPLQLIRSKIGRLKLGKTNEKIEWHKKDEIGELVNEYNRMVDELARSAELLAKSERESAWREMAKQVAHEIKNPLTPMKLSIQHLLRSWEDQKPDWENRLKNFSKTLIEQIDSLSEIASEFSNFAKMPKPVNEKIDLVNIISNSVDIFRDYADIDIDFSYEKGYSYIVEADRKQLIRVFNNLLKNSIQAIPKGRNGTISISLEKDKGYFLVKLRDNGKGIPEEQKENIFSPSFTTKTSGMGLGLAMVRSIILSAEGNIRFESEEGEGTTFFISLPAQRKTKKNARDKN